MTLRVLYQLIGELQLMILLMLYQVGQDGYKCVNTFKAKSSERYLR